MGPILVIAELDNDKLSDASQELITKAREVGAQIGAEVVGLAFGSNAGAALKMSAVDVAIAVGGAAVDNYSPMVFENAVGQVMSQRQPSIVFLSNTTMGMDLGAALAAIAQQSMVAYCTGVSAHGNEVVATSQVYGGKLLAEVEVPLTGTVITVVPGSWPSVNTPASPEILDVTAETVPGMELIKVIAPEPSGDVDITRSDVLVSVGRGIQGPENLELADELAEALGAVVSCSRPVVDAGWLPRARQVGKSGQTVKPKAYMAMGISGAPEHLQGMKDAELIIAVNSDENAPIFEVAHYGATVDILDLMPVLAEKLQGRAG